MLDVTATLVSDFLVTIAKAENKLTGAKYLYSSGGQRARQDPGRACEEMVNWSVLISPSSASSINRGGEIEALKEENSLEGAERVLSISSTFVRTFH